jgi:hypothetical protein
MTTRAFRLLAAMGLLVSSLITGVPGTHAASAATISTVATGLENPRGLKFGPDHQLYVAEGGLGGTTHSTTATQCKQVPPPVGPYTGDFTARVSSINVDNGRRRTVVDHLPSSQTNPLSGGFVSGVADVAFVDRHLYALMAGAGCSHGLLSTTNDMIRVNSDGSTTTVTNLTKFLMENQVANPNPPDFEPDGTWYSMVNVGDRLYAVEPNHGEVDVVTPETGQIRRLVDVSATKGHAVPTSITFNDRTFYLGNLGLFDPGAEGHANVYRLNRSGNPPTVVASGLTAVTGVAVHDGHIYALEAFTGTFAPDPRLDPNVVTSGKVVRLNRRSGKWDPVVTALSFPTAMTFGPDGNLYISNKGFGQPTNTSGEVRKVAFHDEEAND